MPLTPAEKQGLIEKARYIREQIVVTTERCGGSHIGGAFSQTDILTALYFKYMKYDAQNPDLADRDRFVLSKGHGGVGHAVVLAAAGFFPIETVYNFNKTGSPFGMHLDRMKVKGVDASTGSLGHGIGIAVGMAMGAKVLGQKWWTYCVLGDGELNEGSVWEAAMSAAHHKVTNQITFVDRNRLMIDGPTEDVMALEPLKAKWESFGWKVIEINGHDFDEICAAIDEGHANQSGKPVVVIANTVKGKGVDFMENQVKWHYAGLDQEMAKKALDCLKRGA